MDYAFKRGIKTSMLSLIKRGSIFKEDDFSIDIVMDQRTVATNGKFNLAESILHELRGEIMSRISFNCFPTVLPSLHEVNVRYANSDREPLIRAADIIANRVLFECKHGEMNNIMKPNLFLQYLP